MTTKEKTAPEVQGTKVEAKKELTKVERKAKKERIAAKKLKAEQETGAALKAAEEAGKKKGSKKDKTTPAGKTLTDANANNVIAKITVEKDLKYIYPEDCEKGGTKEELLERRKKFRAGVRRKVASFEKSVGSLMNEKKPDQAKIDAIQKEANEYFASVYPNFKAPEPAKKKAKKIKKVEQPA